METSGRQRLLQTYKLITSTDRDRQTSRTPLYNGHPVRTHSFFSWDGCAVGSDHYFGLMMYVLCQIYFVHRHPPLIRWIRYVYRF